MHLSFFVSDPDIIFDMKILSIETSTMLGGVAIVDETAGLIAETRLNVKTTHSERLMTAVNNTLVQSELTLDDIDVFAVAAGPGSFTGLRIGLSTLKGLSYATGKPVVTVPTLEAFAWNFPYSVYPLCLMLDARKSEVYAAVYKWEEDSFSTVIECVSIKPEVLLETLQGRVLFSGEGVLVYREKIIGMMKERAVIAPMDKMVPSPANVAMLGMAKAKRGEFAEISQAVPVYVRRSEAEVKWSGKS
jgi:tRNA threonylcarbamoyladenosine biosynthesis protein TsaB